MADPKTKQDEPEPENPPATADEDKAIELPIEENDFNAQPG